MTSENPTFSDVCGLKNPKNRLDRGAGPSSVLLDNVGVEDGAGPSSVVVDVVCQRKEGGSSIALEDVVGAGPSSAGNEMNWPSTVLAEHLEQKKERILTSKLRPVGLVSRPTIAMQHQDAVTSQSRANAGKVLMHDAQKLPDASSQYKELNGRPNGIGSRIGKLKSSKPLKNKLGQSFKKPKNLDDLEATPKSKILGKKQSLMHNYLAPSAPKDQ